MCAPRLHLRARLIRWRWSSWGMMMISWMISGTRTSFFILTSLFRSPHHDRVSDRHWWFFTGHRRSLSLLFLSARALGQNFTSYQGPFGFFFPSLVCCLFCFVWFLNSKLFHRNRLYNALRTSEESKSCDKPLTVFPLFHVIFDHRNPDLQFFYSFTFCFLP